MSKWLISNLVILYHSRQVGLKTGELTFVFTLQKAEDTIFFFVFYLTIFKRVTSGPEQQIFQSPYMCVCNRQTLAQTKVLLSSGEMETIFWRSSTFYEIQLVLWCPQKLRTLFGQTHFILHYEEFVFQSCSCVVFNVTPQQSLCAML